MQVTFMDNISWLLSNLCQKSTPLSIGLIRPVLSVFDCMLNNKNQYIICKIFAFYLLYRYFIYYIIYSNF